MNVNCETCGKEIQKQKGETIYQTISGPIRELKGIDPSAIVECEDCFFERKLKGEVK